MRKKYALLALLLPVSVLAEVEPSWSYYPGYFSPGQNGIVAANLDGKGLTEALLSGQGYNSKQHLATLESVGTGFQTTHMQYLADNESLQGSLQVLVSPAGTPDRVAAVVRNYLTNVQALVTWSGKPLREIRRIPISASFGLTQVADVDGDGELEVLGTFTGPSGGSLPILLSYNTGAVEWTGTQSVTSISAGQLDTDAALEIVMSGSGPGLVLDGATRTQQWSYLDGFRGRIVFGNFRGTAADGEFAVVEPWGVTRVFISSPIFSPVLELNTGEVNVVVAKDIDANGYDDLVIGEGQWGATKVYSTTTGQIIRTWPRSNHGVSAMALGELDAVPGLDLVFGSGLTSSGEDTVHVVDTVSGTQRYLSVDEAGPHSSVLLVDTDGDGSEELLFASTSSRSGYSGANLRVLRGATGIELRNRLSITSSFSSNSVVSMKASQLDSDAAQEIIVAAGSNANIAVLDGVTLADQWRVTPAGLGYAAAIELIKFNTDAIDDIVVAGGGRIVILDGTTGMELYRSVSFQTTAGMAIAVGQADSDAQLEIVLSVGRNLYVIDPTLGLVENAFTVGGDVRGLRFESTSGSCNIIATRADRLDRLDCLSGLLISQRDLGLNAFWVGIPENSDGSLVLSDGARVYRSDRNGLMRQSVAFGSNLGAGNIGVVRMQGDDINVWVGSSQSVQKVILAPPTVLFSDGFE